MWYVFQPLANLGQFSGVGSLVFAALLLGLVGLQVYRYRHVSTFRERQQTKWAVFGLSVALGGFALFLLVGFLFLPLGLLNSPTAGPLIQITVPNVLLLIIPISISIAILRSRLYDIDVIINRSLVYGSLTILLALIYFGLVIGLGWLMRLFTGHVSESPVVIVASTLAIFVLIQPLRHRIQRIIDRRFYRSKYDSAKIIENFNSRLRDEVDLNTLREHLVSVVQETMQPAHVSLWLRKPDHEVKR